MKKLYVLLLIGLMVYFFWGQQKSEPVKQTASKVPSVEPKAKKSALGPAYQSVFVPYWNVTDDLSSADYDRFIYFGITANSEGVNTSEAGYTNINSFSSSVSQNKEKYVALRLLNSDINLKFLLDRTLQEKVIQETITIANENNFSGIVLDLELSALPVTDMTGQINTFVENFYNSAKNNNIGFSVAIYGDTYFRNRPFDVKYISEHSDEVMIMAYDFSKSYGEPGPNFPLHGEDEYGYDFTKLIEDFTADVRPEKLSVIFGMYGYDWPIGPQGKPLTRAEAVTVNQVNSRYGECNSPNCQLKRDETSSESQISYTDDEGNKHIVWYEDEQSVDAKMKVLREKGIGNIAYWAWGYF